MARPPTAVEKVLAAGVLAAPVLWALDPFATVRRLFLVEHLITLELGASLALVFWLRRGRGGPAAVDVAWRIFGWLSLLTGAWIALRYEAIGLFLFSAGAEPVLLSAALTLLCILGCRLVAGGPMTLLVIGFLVYGYGAQFLTGTVAAPDTQLDSYLIYIALGGDAILGQALTIIATIVVVFIIFGRAFELAGGGLFIEHISLGLTRRSRGASLKVAVVASAMLGSITGSAVSNVLTSGNFSIPMMRRIGLRPHDAAAVEAVSSTGGQLMPPVMGAAAFLMVDIAGIPYGEIIMAAAIPGALFFFAVFLRVDWLAVRLKLDPAESPDAVPARTLVRDGALHAIPIAALVAMLLAYDYAPEWAALTGAGCALAIAGLKSGGWQGFAKDFAASLFATGRSAAQLTVVGGAIGIMLGVINSTGIGVTIAIQISEIAGYGLFAALLAAAAACYLLGLGLATTAVYVIVGTLIAPGLVRIGVPPIAAHLFVFYSAMLSMITPPVAVACLAASGLAGASFLQTCLSAMRIGWILFLLPFLLVFYPELLMIGEPWTIAATLLSVFTGVMLISISVSGHANGKLPTTLRVACLGCALVLLAPAVPLMAKITLAVLSAGLLWQQRRITTRSASPPVQP